MQLLLADFLCFKVVRKASATSTAGMYVWSMNCKKGVDFVIDRELNTTLLCKAVSKRRSEIENLLVIESRTAQNSYYILCIKTDRVFIRHRHNTVFDMRAAAEKQNHERQCVDAISEMS